MAERFYGPHWPVTCKDCQFSFRIGTDYPPSGESVTCSNCGWKITAPSGTSIPGMKVDVLPRDFSTDPPRRFEVVAFRDKNLPDRIQVKRIVGLPGEHVGIRDGDLWINHKRFTKNPEQFAAVSQIVHQSSYWPTTGHRQWKLGESPSWSRQANYFQFTPRNKATDRHEVDDYDWLAILHYDYLVGSGELRESPVLDSLGYNHGLSRQLNRVDDRQISVMVRLKANSRFALNALVREEMLVAELDVAAKKYELRVEDAAEGTIGSKVVRELSFGDQLAIVELGHCEGQAWLRVGEATPIIISYSEKSTEGFFEDYSRWFVGGGRESFEVRHVTITRDIYYLNPLNRADPWAADAPLSSDEFFVLGDNPAGSTDSRTFGPIKLENILGVVKVP